MLVIYNHGNNIGQVTVMKYINGIPEGTEQNRTDKAKQPRRPNHKEQWYIQQMKLDPALKEEHAKHMEFRNWEKEMHDPGEIEHKREMVASLRGGKPIKKKPEEKAKTVLREPLEPVAKVLLTDRATGEQTPYWLTENIVYQDIANGVYWVYNELAQKAIAAIANETRVVDHRGKTYWCKLLKKATGRDLQSYLVDLKKAERTNKK